MTTPAIPLKSLSGPVWASYCRRCGWISPAAARPEACPPNCPNCRGEDR